MSEEEKVVDTLEEENQNTETDLEEEKIDQEETSTSGEDSENKEESISDDVLADLSDDEFSEYIKSGKLPDRKKEVNNGSSNTSDGKIGKPEHKDRVSDASRSLPANAVQKSRSDGDHGSKDETKDSNSNSPVDYKGVYEQIFKPFKANGKEITPRNVEDVISLMQMGANYTKKMQDIAALKRVTESLNKAGIKDEELNFLIDLHNGDKEAIKQLLGKHKVDPMDLDLESTNYKPKDNMVSKEDVKFSVTLEDIKPSLPKIEHILKEQWDAESKEMLLRNPNMLYALHQEIQYGRFDELQNRLELEKTFGRYKDKTDLEAYIDLVGKYIQENQNKAIQSPKKATNTPSKSIPDKSKAAPTKSVPGTSRGSITKEDIFSMSDEDFNKLSLKDLV
jgi:hypothetical protein